MAPMLTYANPTRFMALSAALVPWLAVLTLSLLGVGLYLALYAAPADYQQGESVRIMFIHVPAAWMALFVYSVMAASSLVAVVFKHPLADVAAKTAAPIGACFTFLALATGSLWGKPMWGAWWVWDARLTSVLILFFLYLGYMAVWRAIDEPVRAGRIAAILALVGFVNVPVIKFSVEWWNSLHQPASVLKFGGPSIHISMLTPLLVMAFAYTALFFALHLVAMRSEILKRRIRSMRLARAEGGS
jgi:heme exporter protein C